MFKKEYTALIDKRLQDKIISRKDIGMTIHTWNS